MFDYTKALALARTVDDVWDLHCQTMAGFGFDRVIYGMTRATGANGALGAFEDALVLSGEGFMATLLLSVVPDIWGVLGDG